MTQYRIRICRKGYVGTCQIDDYDCEFEIDNDHAKSLFHWVERITRPTNKVDVYEILTDGYRSPRIHIYPYLDGVLTVYAEYGASGKRQDLRDVKRLTSRMQVVKYQVRNKAKRYFRLMNIRKIWHGKEAE